MCSNNTDPAKGPRDCVSWQAIDIFLFANGQQYSPPRKYHLQANELDDWENTLSMMARAHYGPRFNIIHLYTTDGRKVDTPMELSNGGTYVAVIPPDPFIDTGYTKYLLKACRSWERRQQLQCGTMEPTKPDAGVTETISEDKENNTEKVGKETKFLIKNLPNQNAINEKPIKLTSSKAFEAKGRSISNEKPSLTKKTSPASAAKKSSIRSKHSATKRMSKKTGIKSKTSETTAKKGFNKNIVTVTNKKNYTSGEEIEHEILAKESYKTIILDKPSKELDPAPSVATIPSIYTNPENDTLSVRVPVPEPVIVQEDNNHIEEDEFRTIIKQVVERVCLPINTTSENSGAKIPNIVLSENRIDKYLTLINKGDIVNLKLQIEVKNAEGVTTVTHEKKEHVINLHRSSQVNLEVDIDNLSLREKPEKEIRKGSLQAIISDIYFHNQNGRPKVIILKCPCCDYQYSVDETQSLPLNTKDGQKVVIVMPVNTCGNVGTTEKIKMDKNPGKGIDDEENEQSISTSALSIPQPKENCCERIKNLGYDKYENEETELQTIDTQEQSLPLTLRREITHASAVKFGEVAIKKRSIDEDMVDASVLTDWCNIILEAKAEDDGRYAFYLPSLEKLRNYKL